MDEQILEESSSAASGGLNKALWTKIAMGAVGVCTLGAVTIASVTKKPPPPAPKAETADISEERASYQQEVKKQFTSAKSGWQADTSSSLGGLNELERLAQGASEFELQHPTSTTPAKTSAFPPPSYYNPRPSSGGRGGGGGGKAEKNVQRGYEDLNEPLGVRIPKRREALRRDAQGQFVAGKQRGL